MNYFAAFLGNFFRRRRSTEGETEEVVSEAIEIQEPEKSDESEKESRITSDVSIPSPPEVAKSVRTLYQEYKTTRWLEAMEEMAEMIREELGELEESIKHLKGMLVEVRVGLRDYSKSAIVNRIAGCRNDMSEARAKLEAIEETLRNRGEIENSDYSEEILRIARFRGVRQIRIKDEDISIIVRVLVPYDGEVYDFGDWDIRIGPSWFSGEIYCGQIRTGWIDDDNTMYIGSVIEDVDQFCFGEREAAIVTHMINGEFLEAVELMIASVHLVNEPDEEKIPEYYKRWIGGTTKCMTRTERRDPASLSPQRSGRE